MIVVICDTCKKEIESSLFIELSGKDNGLNFKNPIKNEKRKVNILDHYRDLHFCGKTCFVNYFFY